MNPWILLIVGAAIGGMVGWLLSSLRRNSALSALQIEAEGKPKPPKAWPANFALSSRDLQSKLQASEQQSRSEANLRVAAETRLKETQANLEDQKRLLEEAREQTDRRFPGAFRTKP